NCLLSCCSSNMDEPSSFQSQTEDEDYMMEKTVGYLPLHHELDSGLGWTDGSFHQGELSGLETEEGLDECHTHQGGRAARVRGGSPSSESFISSELSDSGFYSVSTAEFLHFQRLLEKRMRMYNSRLHHQGELQNLCMDTQKAHRELEAIPEALTMQPDSECVETEAYPHQMVRVASMQLRKNERPNLNRHSSSSAAIFSTCSSPSGQQSLTPCATTAAGMLRRSRTLHHRPVPVEQRRRASHPTSPNYCSMTLNRYRHALQQQIPAETKTDAKYYTCHANQPVHHANHLPHHVSHATNHANHITHHVNHPTHHASYSNHQANHPTNNRHLANYTTLHANHPTHMANQAAPNANDFTHPTRHANLSPHPYHATLPAQHTHHTHSAFSSHSPHHDHAHTTLLTQHTNHDHLTLPAQHTHHNHAHPTLPAQHTHHDHTTLLAQHTHHDHTHTTLLATHATLPTQQAHHILRTRPKHAISQPSLSSSTDDHHFAPPQEPWHHDNRGRSFTEPPTVVKVECGKETSGERERGRYHTLSHTPSQEGNDTWPKTTNRHGPYSTLEGHMTTTTLSASKPPVGPSNPRAMRNQLLRERALRVADERSGGISTDDETNVEIRRVGRYWSRSERREQVLQKQRQKREALRGGGANSNTSVGGDSSGYSALMELSQRKLSRLRNRKLLDDWTTVEELLTHGTRLGTHDENIQIPNSLLTVTTV
ncbi:PDZ domain-containing protein 4 isoform X2, partial [Silurus meridionalis]